jgi:hypothetical protein
MVENGAYIVIIKYGVEAIYNYCFSFLYFFVWTKSSTCSVSESKVRYCIRIHTFYVLQVEWYYCRIIVQCYCRVQV